MIKVGLIGCGAMGKAHSAAYEILSDEMDVKITAAADVRAEMCEKVAKAHDATFYLDAEEMIKNADIDVVDICVPTYIHAKYAKMAMEAGKNVFIEKPVVFSPEEGDLLLNVQKETGAQVMVGQCIRTWDAYVYLKKVYDANELGKLKNLTLKRVSNYPLWGFENWYMDINKSGGAVMDLHVHDVDFMRYLLGEPEDISIGGDRHHVFGIYKFKDGVTVQIEGAWDYPPAYSFAMEYRANFENGAITYVGGEVQLYTKDGKVEVVKMGENRKSKKDLGGNISVLNGYYNELKYFYTSLLNNTEMVIAPLSEGIKSIKLVYKEIEAGGF